MSDAIPTQEQLLERFAYHENGGFVWRKGSQKVIGKMAGSLNQKGYMRVHFMGKTRQLHRLVWIYWNGPIPSDKEIDHVNGIKHDNRISNLRLADRSANMLNLQSAHSDSATMFLGVTKHKVGKYQAQFDSKYLGLYSTPEEANTAYLEYKWKQP